MFYSVPFYSRLLLNFLQRCLCCISRPGAVQSPSTVGNTLWISTSDKIKRNTPCPSHQQGLPNILLFISIHICQNNYLCWRGQGLGSNISNTCCFIDPQFHQSNIGYFLLPIYLHTFISFFVFTVCFICNLSDKYCLSS